ncbi:MAG: serpin family protein [Bacteroidales bacterium]|nr:serpin family protein [Candidatus Liminaster caballi]
MKKTLASLLLLLASIPHMMSAADADPWNTAFSLLDEDLRLQGENPKNTCLSPLSLQLALGMVNEGAKGKTRSELNSIMPSGNNAMMQMLLDGKCSQLISANSIWINSSFAKSMKKKFVKQNLKHFGAEVQSKPFGAETVAAINNWCNENTNGKIPAIIDRLTDDDKMVLVNTLYFKARWINTFSKSATQPRTFYNSNGSKTDAMTMEMTASFKYRETEMFQAVELPFESDFSDGENPVATSRFELLVILPKQETGLLEVLDSLKSGKFSLTDSYKRVHLRLPRFRCEYGTSLIPHLQAMGVSRCFTPAAQFKGISRTKLLISEVMQKTFISVDEDGAEAAAATAVSMRIGAARPRPEQPIEMYVDRPFIYVITESLTGTPVFVGAITNL